MTSDGKFSYRNMQNYRQQFQTALFQKLKAFSGFFIAFLKCAGNVEPFEKKDEYRRIITSEIIESERGGYLNLQQVLLQNTIR